MVNLRAGQSEAVVFHVRSSDYSLLRLGSYLDLEHAVVLMISVVLMSLAGEKYRSDSELCSA